MEKEMKKKERQKLVATLVARGERQLKAQQIAGARGRACAARVP